ncbi:MAG: outer membrane protein assembly factor BamE [Alphaproteobacteria bacterium]|nr:outer membrane protein assembly factor BamE [Alphaproteobacteria bacterium]
MSTSFCVAALALSGCSNKKYDLGVKIRPDQMRSIENAKTQAEVIQILGSPQAETRYGAIRWYYASAAATQFAFLRPSFNEYTILAIEFDSKGKVVEVASRDIRDARFRQAAGKTEILTDIEVGFFEELFGNVGKFAVGPMAVDPNATRRSTVVGDE